ncbi:MAG: regulatory protein RecX, partial [Candidatus Bipolaricaulia bacterium]
MPRDEAKQYLLRLLRYRPRSRAEAESRLRKRGYSDELIREILTWAEDMGMIDDEAFAKLWIADRLERRPRGRALLRRELREKGVSPGLIERALDRAGMDEEALA